MSTDRPATTDPADERMRDLADQRAEDFVNNLTGRAEQEHIRKVIAEAVRKAVPMHSGGWVTANNVLDALDREGYTVAPRASEAPGGDGRPTPAEEAVRGGEGGSAAESEPRPMRGEDVPAEWIALASRGYSMHGAGLVANLLAAVIPAIRAQVADEIEATIGGYPENEAVRPKVERGGYLNDADWAAAIARGDQ